MANAYDPYAAQTGSYGSAPDLQFYSGAGGAASGSAMHPSTATGLGSMSHASSAQPSMNYYSSFGGADAVPSGNMQSGSAGVGGVMLNQGGFWSAFTAAPIYEGEPPLLEGAQMHLRVRSCIC